MKTFVSEKIQTGENRSEKKIKSKLRFNFLREGQSVGKSALGLESSSENFESSPLALLL